MSKTPRLPLALGQRAEDIKLLQAVLDTLPTGHAEKPGVIRAIEILRTSPLRLENR